MDELKTQHESLDAVCNTKERRTNNSTSLDVVQMQPLTAQIDRSNDVSTITHQSEDPDSRNIHQHQNIKNESNDHHRNATKHKKRQLYCDCLLFTPTVVICLLAIALYMLSVTLPTRERQYHECDSWNLLNSPNHTKYTSDQCHVYQNSINDTNDAWRLCNMFINIEQLHNTYWNWFDNINNDTMNNCSSYNDTYNNCNIYKDGNINISIVCNWKGITCNENQTNILEINFQSNSSCCSEVNMSYIPSNLILFRISYASIRFEWDPLVFPITLQRLHLEFNDVYGNMNNMSRFKYLQKLDIRGNKDLNNIDFKSLSDIDVNIWAEETQRCDPLSYCQNENFRVTDRISNGCEQGSGYRCLETCGYCTPKDYIGGDYVWQPRMNDLTTMCIVLIGCLVCTVSTIIGILCAWQRNWDFDIHRRRRDRNNNNNNNTNSLYLTVMNENYDTINNSDNHSGGNFHVLVNHVGFGPLISCVGILLLLIFYLASVIESDRYVIGIATLCAASLTTSGWGTMDYGFFGLEKKLGFLKRVVIDKKYKQQIANHDRMGKLYWYYKQKLDVKNLNGVENKQSSKYVIFIKAGSNKCLALKICQNCCYARECQFKLNCWGKCNGHDCICKIIGPSYMEWRLLFGATFAPMFSYLPVMWYYARQHTSWGPWYVLPIDLQFLDDWRIEPSYNNIMWAFTCVYALLLIFPSIFSKLALIQGLVFIISFIIINSFEKTLFPLPYYDSAGISITGPKSITPITVWICIIWSMGQLIVSLHFSRKIEMRRLSSVVTAKFLSIFDIITDILVVYSWIGGRHFTWASIQLVILLLSQIFLTKKTNELHSSQLQRLYAKYHSKGIKSPKLSRSSSILINYETRSGDDVYKIKLKKLKCRQTFEKIITFLGMGRLWFASKVWIEYENHDHYQRVKLWEILLESFPSVALMYYVTLSQESGRNGSVMASIIISFINICVASAKTTSEYITHLKTDKSHTVSSAINIFQLPSPTQMRQNQQNHRNKFEIELDHDHELENEELKIGDIGNQTRGNSNSTDYGDSIPTTNLQLQQKYSLSSMSRSTTNKTDSKSGNENTVTTSISIENLIIVDKKTGQVSFKFEKDYKSKGNKPTGFIAKQLYKLKKFILSKKEYVFEAFVIAFVLTFVLSDLYIRISPPIVLFITLRNMNNMTIVSSVIATVTSILLACLILFQNYYVYRSIKFVMVISGFFTNWYYFSCAIGMDYFDTMIEWNDFNKEHISRMIISAFVIVTIVIISLITNEWEFDSIIIGFFIMIVINLVQLHFLQRIPKLNR